MASYYRRIDREIQVSEATAAKATVIFEVGTHEAQTVTVSKAGGAFGSSTTTAAQVDGNLYKLVIAAADLDTEGELAFKCVGATDTQYVYGFMVVDHDPFDAIAAILDDTGTSGVALIDGAVTAAKLGADCITSAKIADDAIGAEHLAADTLTAASIATDAIAADGLAATATAEIADAVLKEVVSDHKGTAGSIADVLNDIWRRIGFGLRTTDTDDDTIKTYDGTTDGATLLVTETKSTAGSETDWTPS